MSHSENNWLNLFQELEKRESQYSFVEVKGIICLENNTWRNLVTKIYPKADSSPSAPFTYNYGDVKIFSRSIEARK
ncbi:MAG: hypothetical protein ACP5PT_08995, partial [Brevinematia bacterium]